MKIYTKKGDGGETSLIGGKRVAKDHLRIEAYGTIDELNSWLGMLSAQVENPTFLDGLNRNQHILFNLGSLLAADPDGVKMQLPELIESDITRLEEEMDRMNEILPELRNFVLPGGHAANASAHIARCVCRRAERLVVALNREKSIDPNILKYLNRLSDWLFVLSRAISFSVGAEEILWRPNPKT